MVSIFLSYKIKNLYTSVEGVQTFLVYVVLGLTRASGARHVKEDEILFDFTSADSFGEVSGFI